MNFLLALFFSISLYAQINAPINPIDYQQNPSDIEWKKIDTDHFEIIFPEEISEDAQRVAHLLEKAYPYVSRSLQIAPPKISLVLQNQSTQSNGFVTLAPRRSEWYVTPSVDPELNNTEWLKTLAVHEFRHVVQFEKSRSGFNRFLYVILGEVGQALGIGLTMPPWFLEGDAVGIETALTNGGRGRLPLFERDLRTLLLSGKNFTYDKAHMRSYDDWVPNHYVYGYFLTSYLRSTYGDLMSSKLIAASAQMSYYPLSFYTNTDRLTHHSFEKFYADAMKNLISEWKAKYDELKPTPLEVKTLGKRYTWTNYYYPQFTNSGKVLALKRGLSFIDEFVLVDGEKDHHVLYPGPFAQEYPFKLRNDRLAYLENEYDPRWGYRDFARLKVFDLEKDEVILDLRKTKYRLAVLNQAADKILLVEWNVKQGQSILVLDMKGEESKRIPYPKEEVITSLDWINDTEIVMVVKDRKDEKGLLKFSLENSTSEVLEPKSLTNWAFVSVEAGNILLEGPRSGIDNIFLYTGKELKQITSAKFGAYGPDFHNGELIYNDYEVKGMDVVKKDMTWDEEQKSSDSFVPFYEKFAGNENKPGLDQDLTQPTEFKFKDYSQLKNAINIHSWTLLGPPLLPYVQLAAYSRDILNKFSLSGGGIYNINEQTTMGFASAAWSHYYPVFDLRAAYGNRRQDLLLASGAKKENRWEEGTFEAGASVPWRLITGRFTQNFTLRAFAKLIKVTNKVSRDTTNVNDGALFSPGSDLDYSILSRLAFRDLYPKWGFRFAGHVEEGRDITGVKQRGSFQSLDTRYYLPGLAHHHSFYHQVAYEHQQDNSYQYSSFVFYPRGTQYFYLQELRKYSANYTMPLFYPDLNLSRYLYLKRMALNLFYDELNGRDRSFNYKAASTGWEVLFETHVLRIFLPFTWGVRGSYLINGERKNTSNYELFLATVLGSY